MLGYPSEYLHACLSRLLFILAAAAGELGDWYILGSVCQGQPLVSRAISLLPLQIPGFSFCFRMASILARGKKKWKVEDMSRFSESNDLSLFSRLSSCF